MVFVCFLAFLLALAAFLVGWFEGGGAVDYIGIDMHNLLDIGDLLTLSFLHSFFR